MTDPEAIPEDDSTEVDIEDGAYQFEFKNITKQPPKRVVSCVPSMTETLFDLGFGDKVVGVTEDCLYPEGKLDSKTRVGLVHELTIDVIVGLYPDLVIINLEENVREDIEKLEAAGLKLWKTFPRTVHEAMQIIWDVLQVFMVDDRLLYERVNLINRTIDWVGGVSEAHEEIICKVFAPVLADPLTTFGKDTYTHDLLRVAGGTNVFADRVGEMTSDDPADDLSRYPVVTLDDVVAAKPEIVLLPAYPHSFTEADVDTYSKLDIPAAANNQIYLIDGALLTYHSTRLARALNEISALMCAVDEDDD